MPRWLWTIVFAGALAAIGATARFWVPLILRLPESHERALGIVTNAAQWLFWFVAAVQAAVRHRPSTWSIRTGTIEGSRAGRDQIGSARDVQTGGQRFEGPVTFQLDPATRERIAAQAASASAVSLHQLPRPLDDLVGRERELADLTSRFAGRGATISGLAGVAGMGGVGKTVLAAELADRLKKRYPDAQFYLDLRGTSAPPLTAAEAMAHVVRSCRPDIRIPDNEAELAGLYRSLLEGKRALLLMDNAADRDQVLPLIPPKGCAMLVTSRQHFDLPGLAHLDLDTLTPESARKLLLKLAPRIRDEAAAIAEACGCLPKALRLAGEALSGRKDLDPAEYASRLNRAKHRLKVVDVSLELAASLELSYKLLDADMQPLWRSLAVFPGTFDRLAAAAVWDVEPEAAGDRMGTLVNYSMVEWDEDGERYRLHDMLRVLADERLAKRERAAAEERHAGYYLVVLAAADDLYLQGGEDVRRGLDLYDLEALNIEAGQRWAAEHTDESEAARALCSEYPDAGVYVLSLRLHARHMVAWLEAAVRCARQLNDRRAEGNRIGNLGNAYRDLGETHRAIEFYEQHLVIAREVGDRRGEGQALGNLGNAHADLGETTRAIEFYEQQLAIAREMRDRRGEGNALGNLGIAYRQLGSTRPAIAVFKQALAIHREIGDRTSEAKTLGNLGNAYGDLGETERAIECHERNIAVAREIGDRRGEGNALGNLGNAYLALGDHNRALAVFGQALPICREVGDRRAAGGLLWNVAVAADALGQRDQAIPNAEAALAILARIEDPHAEMVRRKLAEWRGEPRE